MFKTIKRGMDKALPVIAALFLLLGTCSTVFGAAIRTLHIPLTVTWVEEVTRFSIVWGTLLLVGIGFRKGLLTQLTIIQDRLRGKVRESFELLLNLLSLVLFSLLLIGGVQFALNGKDMISAGLHIRIIYPYLAIPVCAAIADIELLMLCVENVARLLGKEVDSEDKEGSDTCQQ